MKKFTEKDLSQVTKYPCIYASTEELVYAPMWYHTRGLMQTATGYGRKLNTGYKINFEGRLYRIYCCIFSNAGTSYFTVKGKEIIVS